MRSTRAFSGYDQPLAWISRAARDGRGDGGAQLDAREDCRALKDDAARCLRVSGEDSRE